MTTPTPTTQPAAPQWTPGPLVVHRALTTRQGFDIETADGRLVAWNLKSGPDAHLFAAAPELYAALQEATQDMGVEDAPWYDAARAALAKAEGRAP